MLPASRREFLQRSGFGLGALALPGLLSDAGLATPAQGALSPMSPRMPHFPAKAKHVIHIFCNGGPSHVDTFDPKPKLNEYHGKELPTQNLRTERKTGAALGSPFRFRKYGESGIEVSELFANVGQCIDDIAVVRSMYAEVPNHEPSLMLMNCGEARQSRPSFGSWVTYGMGTENQNLPGFIAMCPGGLPITETANWRSSFLPGVFQGTYVDTKETDVEKLIADIRNKQLPLDQQRKQLDLVQSLNRRHLAERGTDPALESRIHSFELAYRMQTDAADAFDISREPKHIQEMYGKGTHARQLLIARRLVERGVRFVQLWHGAGQPWDNHDDLEVNHRKLAGQIDQPLAALLKDLKQRGLLDETLILWGGEFGRTPVVELPTAGANAGKINGRDHNHWGFTVWLAGGASKGARCTGRRTSSDSRPLRTASRCTTSTPRCSGCSASTTSV